MTRSEMVHARVEPRLKREAERVFRALGLSVSDVVNALYAQVTLRKGVPFSLDIPNLQTRRAIVESRAGLGRTFRNKTSLHRYLGETSVTRRKQVPKGRSSL